VVDGESQSAIVAFDKANGQEVWRTPRASRGSWTSPILVNAGSDDAPRWELIVNGTGTPSGSPGAVIAYDPATGRELWKVLGTSDIPCPTAIAGDGIVISSSGSNGPIFALRPGEIDSPRKIWSLPSGGPYVPTGIIYENRLILISDSGQATCHRLEDGEVVWKKRLHGAFSASLVAGGGNIYAVSERGDVYVFKSGDRFELVTTNRLREPCLATPAIVGDEIILRTQRHLYCIGETHLAASAAADVSPAVEPHVIQSPADTNSSALTAP
jgi:outer membrane protein assembly factor BamB